MKPDPDQNSMARPPVSFRRVAIASKVHHATELATLWKQWPHIHFTSMWPVICLSANGKGKPVSVWQEDNFAAIRNAEFLIVYAEDNDTLKGGLVEVGYAFAHGLPIYVIGMNRVEQLGEWQLHKQCKRVPSLDAALTEITNTLNYPKEKA